MTTDNSIWFD